MAGDDDIVHEVPAVLELQAKRTIAFTASDRSSRTWLRWLAGPAATPEFVKRRCELAVVIARTATKIEQDIQDVLKWVREYQDAEAFFRRLIHGRAPSDARVRRGKVGSGDR